MLRKLLTLSDCSAGLMSAFLPPAQTLLFWLLTGGLDKKNVSLVKKTRFVSRTLSRRSRILNDFRAQVVVQSF